MLIASHTFTHFRKCQPLKTDYARVARLRPAMCKGVPSRPKPLCCIGERRIWNKGGRGSFLLGSSWQVSWSLQSRPLLLKTMGHHQLESQHLRWDYDACSQDQEMGQRSCCAPKVQHRRQSRSIQPILQQYPETSAAIQRPRGF